MLYSTLSFFKVIFHGLIGFINAGSSVSIVVFLGQLQHSIKQGKKISFGKTIFTLFSSFLIATIAYELITPVAGYPVFIGLLGALILSSNPVLLIATLEDKKLMRAIAFKVFGIGSYNIEFHDHYDEENKNNEDRSQ